MHIRNSLESEECRLLRSTGYLNTSFTELRLIKCATVVVEMLFTRILAVLTATASLGMSVPLGGRALVLVSVD
jgi:hypothetical protein